MKINCSYITFNNKPKCLLRKTDNFHNNEEQSMMILNKVYEVENSNVHN